MKTYHESTDIGNVKGRSHSQIQSFSIGDGVGSLKISKFLKFSHRRQFVIVSQKDPTRRFSRDDCDGWRICLACLRHTSHQHYPERGPGVFIHGYMGMDTNEHATNNESMSTGFFCHAFFLVSLVFLCLFLNMVLL